MSPSPFYFYSMALEDKGEGIDAATLLFLLWEDFL